MRGFSSFSGSKRVARMVILFSAKSTPLISTRLWLEVRDANVSVLEARRELVGLERHGVLQVLLVVAFREVSARVRPARFLAGQRRVRDGVGDLEHEVELERGRQLG